MQGLNTLAGYGQNANSQNIQLGLGYGGLNNQLTLGYGNQAGQTAGLATTLANAGAQTSLQGNQYIGNVGLQGTVDAGNFSWAGAQGTAAGQMGQANAWQNAFKRLRIRARGNEFHAVVESIWRLRRRQPAAAKR